MKKLLLGAAMLLGGISLNAQDGPQIGKDDATYTDVDVNGQTMAVYPLWGWYTALGNQNYGIIGANSRGMAISADGSKMLISNRVADNDIHVEIYNALTGEHIKSVQVSKDIWYRGKTTDKDGNEVDDISGFQANDIQVDAAGNVLLWRMTTNIGVSPAECWAVNLEDGSVKNILSTTVEGLEGRFDYCGVYGDVVNGDGYILSATSNGDELYGKTVLKWRYVGGKLQPQEESDQIFIQEYYPEVEVTTPEDCKNFVLQNSEHGGADVVLEVAGGADTFRLAWDCARPNAIVTIVALYDKPQLLPLPDMYGKNLIFKTGGVDGCDCAEILRLIEEGKIDTTPLITHRFPLKDIGKAYHIFENKLDGVIKVAIISKVGHL